jgi:hypothetical protein
MSDATVRELVLTIKQYLNDHYGYVPRSHHALTGRSNPLPEGLRLEIHPATHIAMWRDPWLAEQVRYTTAINPEQQWAEMIGCPLKVDRNSVIKPGGFRLVIVTEDLLLTGTIGVPS